MGKRLITQARGKGGPRWRANSHRWAGTIAYPAPSKELLKGEILDIINSAGHSSPLMLVKYEDAETLLLPAPLGMKVGTIVYSGAGAPVELGCILSLDEIPSGYPVYNIERIPYNGPELVRASGSAATIVGKEAGKIMVKLPSKETLLLNPKCRATIGLIAGSGRTEKPWTKAGKKFIALRAKGGRVFPRVSGVAQNSIDHPFGGSHRRSLGRPTTTRRHGISRGRRVGLLAARKTGRGK